MKREIRITIAFKISPQMARVFLVFGLIAALPLELGSETLTLSTTYPAPFGAYNSIITTGGSIASPKNTLLGTVAGTVGIGTTTPDVTKKLDVAGDIHASGRMFLGTGSTGSMTVYVCPSGTLTVAGTGCVGAQNPLKNAGLTIIF